MDFQKKVDDVVIGMADGLIVLAELKAEKKRIDELIKTVEPIAFEEADKFDGKKFEFKGWEFERRSGGAMYNFKNIPEWNETKEQLSSIEDKAKQAYQSYKKGILSATTDGEEIILPEVTERKDSLIIKQSKTK